MLDRRLLLGALATLAAPADAAFAPPDGVTFRYISHETRTTADAVRDFEIERRLIFHRSADGFVAEITVLPPADNRGDATRAMFNAAYAALAGIPVRFRLDRDGHLLAVENREAVWRRLVAAIGAMAPAGSSQRPLSEALSKGLASMPAERQDAFLAAALGSIIAPEITPGEREITLPTARYGDEPVTLRGTETTLRAADGTLRVTTDARGTAVTTEMRNIAVTLERVRTIDTATGLVRSLREETETRIVIDSIPLVQQSTQTAELFEAVPQYPSGKPPKP